MSENLPGHSKSINRYLGHFPIECKKTFERISNDLESVFQMRYFLTHGVNATILHCLLSRVSYSGYPILKFSKQ